MRVAIIADVFPPLRSSGAVQLRDLSREFARQGHEVSVLVASPELTESWHIEEWNGVRIVRLKTPRTKDVGYVRRALGEFLMPYAMLRALCASPLSAETWDGVVWYSPTIFLGPIAKALKKASGCPGYLIIRDIFPEWAVDMGIMGRGLPYRVFKAVANYKYSVADIIGVQTPGNLAYFAGKDSGASSVKRVEVLHNWLADAVDAGCSIAIDKTPLAGRKIFAYAGNMGIAQGMGILLDLAERLITRADIGFVFVGRGSDAAKLKASAAARNLENVIFYDEIDPDEIPGLYAQCSVGLVALDPKHKTHNIPGKFLSYMQAGLPVLASINPGNDLAGLIAEFRVGRACTDNSAASLAAMAEELIAAVGEDGGMGGRCKTLSKKMFAADVAVRKITAAIDYDRQTVLARNAGYAHKGGDGDSEEEEAPEYPSKL